MFGPECAAAAFPPAVGGRGRSDADVEVVCTNSSDAAEVTDGLIAYAKAEEDTDTAAALRSPPPPPLLPTPGS